MTEGLRKGDRIDKRYSVVKRLGGGNFGDVYLAEEMQGGRALRQVAVKVFRQQEGDFSLQPQPGSDLAAEYSAMVSAIETAPPELRRHFIQVYAMGEEEGVGRYIAMEFLKQADTLEKVIERNNASGFHPPAETVIRYGRQLLAALNALHRAGFVHCDIKPDNLYIQGDTLRIGDFGLTVRTQSFLQQSGPAGQIYYMAPEVFSGNVSTASDVYSAGLTVYEHWTGRHPFKEKARPSDSLEGASHRQRQLRDQWSYQSGTAVHPMVSASAVLDAVLRKCLRRALHERYADAGQALTDLDAPPAQQTPWQAAAAGARALQPTDPPGCLREALKALELAPPDSRQQLDSLLLLGDAHAAMGQMPQAIERYAAAHGLDTRLNLLLRDRDARRALLQKLADGYRKTGKTAYAAMYERRLKAVK